MSENRLDELEAKLNSQLKKVDREARFFLCVAVVCAVVFVGNLLW